MTTDIQPLTAQAVFDAALHGVIAQGGFSRTGPAGTTCVYRAAKGLKCGIGHSIPDDLYSIEFDKPPQTGPLSILHENGSDVVTLCEAAPDINSLFRLCSGHFLEALQGAHDKADDMEDFRARMREVAAKHDVIYTESEQS